MEAAVDARHVNDKAGFTGGMSDVEYAAKLGELEAAAEAKAAREAVLSSDDEVEFGDGAEVDLAAPVKVKKAKASGGAVARLRAAVTLEEDEDEGAAADAAAGGSRAVVGGGAGRAPLEAAGGAACHS